MGLSQSFTRSRCMRLRITIGNLKDTLMTFVERTRKGFTLIELLVVIAIIAVLIASVVAGRPGCSRGCAAGAVH